MFEVLSVDVALVEYYISPFPYFRTYRCNLKECLKVHVVLVAKQPIEILSPKEFPMPSVLFVR